MVCYDKRKILFLSSNNKRKGTLRADGRADGHDKTIRVPRRKHRIPKNEHSKVRIN